VNFDLKFRTLGQKAIIIDWPQEIRESILYDILELKESIKREIPSCIDCVLGFASLTLIFDESVSLDEKAELILDLRKTKDSRKSPSQSWSLPVCYHGEESGEPFGLDLQELAIAKSMSVDDLISLHASSKYLVYFYGFLPGFAYLGGLDEGLHFPRKSEPRHNIPAGSVAIGGSQAGIYSIASPGGWNVVGRTPVSLFDLSLESPSPINPGDSISFREIDYSTFQNLRDQIDRGDLVLLDFKD